MLVITDEILRIQSTIVPYESLSSGGNKLGWLSLADGSPSAQDQPATGLQGDERQGLSS